MSLYGNYISYNARYSELLESFVPIRLRNSRMTISTTE